MKKFIAIIIVLAAIAGAVYYFVINKPHRDVNDEAAIEIAAPQLFAEFTANEAEANKKYLNKAILVSGIVSAVEENQDKQKYMILQTDDALNGVMCTMRSNDFSTKTGDQVSVKGFCSGFVGDVKLTDCVLNPQ
ncbi:MAG: hypothetical protein JNL13_08760 [Chitinophagaceae bacterium]|nr:hypothetical protein [Chitinophagaceae bacterium]